MIHVICGKYNILNYTINDDLSIDVDSDVNLSNKGLTEFPLKFNRVSGSFDCENNILDTLEGCPQFVGGSFYCENNRLSNIEGCPHTVGDNFYCGYNKITSLAGCPKELNGIFCCSSNKLTSLEHCPTKVSEFYCTDNNITNLDFIPNEISDVFMCRKNPIGSIFNHVEQDFLQAFKTYKVIKGDQVNFKRLKYVMGIFDKKIRLEKIKQHYTIV